MSLPVYTLATETVLFEVIARIVEDYYPKIIAATSFDDIPTVNSWFQTHKGATLSYAGLFPSLTHATNTKANSRLDQDLAARNVRTIGERACATNKDYNLIFQHAANYIKSHNNLPEIGEVGSHSPTLSAWGKAIAQHVEKLRKHGLNENAHLYRTSVSIIDFFHRQLPAFRNGNLEAITGFEYSATQIIKDEEQYFKLVLTGESNPTSPSRDAAVSTSANDRDFLVRSFSVFVAIIARDVSDSFQLLLYVYSGYSSPGARFSRADNEGYEAAQQKAHWWYGRST